MFELKKCVLLLLLIAAIATAMPEAYNRNIRSPGPHEQYYHGYRGEYYGGHGGHGGSDYYDGGPHKPNFGHGGSNSESQANAQAGSNSGYGGSNSYASASSSSGSYSRG